MLTEIERALPGLSRAERSVADWILADPAAAMSATVSDAARAAGTSEPTVVRFCRSVGADGFRDFKLKLAGAIAHGGSYAHCDVSLDDSAEDAAGKVVDGSIRALYDLREQLGHMPIESAVAALAAARQIVFAGLGASGDVARDALQKFFRLGIPCTVATDPPALLQYGAVAGPDDVFVAISRSGAGTSLVEGCRLASANGAVVIAITPQSTALANVAGLLFALDVAEDPNVYTPMSGRLAQLALLDALQVALALELGPPAEVRLKAAKNALAQQQPGAGKR